MREEIETVKKDILMIASEENLAPENSAFVIWVLEQYFNLPRDEAVRLTTDGPNDKKVDAYIDNDEDKFIIISCSFFGQVDREEGEKEIAAFKGCIDWLKNPDQVQKLNRPKLFDASNSFIEAWEQGLNVELHYFVFGKFADGAQRERKVFNQSDERVQMFFHDIGDILNLYKANAEFVNPLSNEEITISLTPGQYFQREGTIPALVATVKGKEIAEMFGKYGVRLFEMNIRLFKGSRKGSINAGIINTISSGDERNKFWYFNNGISFVCSDFHLSEKREYSPTVKIKGFQIINGCQTTCCLDEAKQRISGSEIPEDVDILVRFIKAPQNVIDAITLYTNSQNPVSETQLKSKHPVQRKLKEEFESYSPPYFYSIREGDWQRLAREERDKFGNRRVEMADAAQALYSFLYDPAYARRYKIELFSKQHERLFKKDITVEEVLLPWQILMVIRNKIKDYRVNYFNKIRKTPDSATESERSEIERKEFLLYSDLALLYFVHRLIQKRYGDYTSLIAKRLLNKQLEDRISRLFDYIVAVLKYSEALKKERTNLPRFLKNMDNIKSLSDEIEKEVEKDISIGKNPSINIFPNIR